MVELTKKGWIFPFSQFFSHFFLLKYNLRDIQTHTITFTQKTPFPTYRPKRHKGQVSVVGIYLNTDRRHYKLSGAPLQPSRSLMLELSWAILAWIQPQKKCRVMREYWYRQIPTTNMGQKVVNLGDTSDSIWNSSIGLGRTAKSREIRKLTWTERGKTSQDWGQKRTTFSEFWFILDISDIQIGVDMLFF